MALSCSPDAALFCVAGGRRQEPTDLQWAAASASPKPSALGTQNEQANYDEPSEPPGDWIIVTEQWLEEGLAEVIEPLCERVHKVGVCSRHPCALPVSGDGHRHGQREDGRDEPQRADGEMVTDKSQHYANDRDYEPYEPRMHAVP